MKKVMKVIGIAIIILVVLLLMCYVNHKVQSKRERTIEALGYSG